MSVAATGQGGLRMKRILMGILLGLMLGSAAKVAHGTNEQRMSEAQIDAMGAGALEIPSAYGSLVDVAVSSEIHHLYFQDSQGEIRVVLIGPHAAAQKARHAIQTLSDKVYVIKRTPS